MRTLTTPVAILLGISLSGACIAIALFAAFRARPAPAPDGTRAPAVAELAPPPLPTGPIALPSASAAPASPVVASAEGALAAQHARLVSTCWEPIGAKGGGLSSARYVLRMSFDAKGKQSSKGLLLAVGASRLELTECVAKTLSPLAIAPQDAGVTLDVSLTLP